MNKTEHYQLNQWELHDRVMMQDFNSDNAKIDAALDDHEDRVAALEAIAPKHGNCQIYAASYTGDGQYGSAHPTVLTFPKKPVWITILNDNGRVQVNILPEDIDYSYSGATSTHKVSVKWSGNTVSWYGSTASVQMTQLDKTYYVIAFWPMD